MHTGDKGILVILYNNTDLALLESPLLDTKFMGKAKIYVYENEGSIPHCHIVGFSEKEICIRLDKAEYFSHGTKIGKLNSKERKLFNEFMHSRNQLGVEQWKAAASMWNGYALDDETKIQIKIKDCPDYLKLK